MQKVTITAVWNDGSVTREVTFDVTPAIQVEYESEAKKRHWPFLAESLLAGAPWMTWRTLRRANVIGTPYDDFLNQLISYTSDAVDLEDPQIEKVSLTS